VELTNSVTAYIDEHMEELQQLLIALAQIPAPSHHEEQRAAFCRDWLTEQGCEGVFVDDVLNVIYPLGCDADKPLIVFMAHSDVVFPDTNPLPLEIRDGRIYCPGVGDDSANVAALMMTAKYIAETGLCPQNHGVLLVVNSCEEGLGNLKGSRHIMERYGERIVEFYSLDGTADGCVDRAVGSRRFRVSVETEGGHSYADFGNRNAIAVLSEMISDLYRLEVPSLGKTTYNVGEIRGGTSVNTIAQQAEMLYEFRSDERDSLYEMQHQFDAIINAYRSCGLRITVELVGDRPCGGDVDRTRQLAMLGRVSDAVERHFGHTCPARSGSTDCNIPLSMGIPAVCVGCYHGAGAHTRQEYVEIDSLLPGLKLAFDLILHHF